MKKLLYEVIGNLYEIAFPKKLIKDRRSLLLVVLESCRYMMQNETVDHADNIMVLAVKDMNRLFFCKEKKMYSIVFPRHFIILIIVGTISICYPSLIDLNVCNIG